VDGVCGGEEETQGAQEKGVEKNNNGRRKKEKEEGKGVRGGLVRGPV